MNKDSLTIKPSKEKLYGVKEPPKTPRPPKPPSQNIGNENGIDMTALEVVKRFDEVRKYIKVLSIIRNSISNYNEVFGEGAPDVSVIEKVIGEYTLESDELQEKLSKIVV